MDPLQNQNQPVIQQPIPDQPPPPPPQQTPPSTFGYVSNTKPPSKKSFLKIIIMIFLALTLLTASATVMFGYGLIPIGSKELQDKMADVIMKIPFMPKTPRYVLRTSIAAHENITKITIDASLAASVSGLSGVLGMSSLDAQVKGSFDYTNFDDFKADFNAKITKDFDADVLTVSKKAYFKINSYPTLIDTMLPAFGMAEDTLKGITNKWFYYDIASLDTEARRNLQDQKNKFELNEPNQKFLEALGNKDIVNSISMVDDQIDGISSFHIVFKPTDDVLDTLWKTYGETDNSTTPNRNLSQDSISKTVKNFLLEVWIDKSHYLVRKMSVSVVFKTPKSSYSMPSIDSFGLPLSEQEIPVSFVVKFSDFNKEVIVTAPENPIKFEDFLKTIITPLATKSAITPSKKLPIGI